MPTKPLSATKIRTIIALYWVSRLSYRELSKVFNVSSSTVGKYLSAFDRSGISLAQTRLLTDQALRELPCPSRPLHRSRRHEILMRSFPVIHQCLISRTTTLLCEWQCYRNQHPSGYSYSQFTNLYGQWLASNGHWRCMKTRRTNGFIALSFTKILRALVYCVAHTEPLGN